ncbi:MAG: preprotein translocase subunit SecE [Candidatus Taylorbacteria bacterium RIFCSPHIGHO2_02_FULL_47_18]|uniref:Protein translocase subunit SecE n=1 Tax=Candidatus Taylorbacteria bacterium RIFCSPLOWO2_01_FULL_48_100 TaxID=1802322 RepID=A0A1G2NER6_9BACT|nr:MAG: preprotein translocase subunit SecE [Candidatus Taylorbacteria bacterium RIFCSPHIGHO2_01_FULL_48_38]OHA27511.1 MAG: preprotein translocase subunit SecE [Candidatus Taylorbacteria bacterium RIFCSPHIGHO2_02_FULL_47_18]OHA34575.1 MAG: preprotein translocase subunit SecE [Candidatus Taylorbacteria bacterium RIFCSPLOWO2_01_FULL_48_100]OHA40338.1 MAG: preprotein translocase subunit SecE [Candidatus Taylorbacteria bacterium RIFCSPLOWO2_02_FULL_48_16]OHA44996.1 MAG: preprotein translocase subun
MSRITEYLKETRGELRHVNWPTRKQASVFTALVVAVSLITAAYLGVFDYLFSLILRQIF